MTHDNGLDRRPDHGALCVGRRKPFGTPLDVGHLLPLCLLENMSRACARAPTINVYIYTYIYCDELRHVGLSVRLGRNCEAVKGDAFVTIAAS